MEGKFVKKEGPPNHILGGGVSYGPFKVKTGLGVDFGTSSQGVGKFPRPPVSFGQENMRRLLKVQDALNCNDIRDLQLRTIQRLKENHQTHRNPRDYVELERLHYWNALFAVMVESSEEATKLAAIMTELDMSKAENVPLREFSQTLKRPRKKRMLPEPKKCSIV